MKTVAAVLALVLLSMTPVGASAGDVLKPTVLAPNPFAMTPPPAAVAPQPDRGVPCGHRIARTTRPRS
jgi:hypothetical protein